MITGISSGYLRILGHFPGKRGKPCRSYQAEAEKQIADAGCRARKDSVRVVETLITASPEFFQGKKPREVKEFFEYTLEFIQSKQSSETIISAVVHMDEKTPHAMEEWLEEYQIQLEQTQTQTVDPIDTALETVHSQLTGLQLQQEKICEYLEKGIYSVEMFSKRNAALSKEIEQLRDSETDLLRQKSEGNKRNRAASELIPTTQHILDSYDALTVEEKNSLWKLVIRRATIYREPEGEVRIQIYPNLPR